MPQQITELFKHECLLPFDEREQILTSFKYDSESESLQNEADGTLLSYETIREKVAKYGDKDFATGWIKALRILLAYRQRENSIDYRTKKDNEFIVPTWARQPFVEFEYLQNGLTCKIDGVVCGFLKRSAIYQELANCVNRSGDYARWEKILCYLNSFDNDMSFNGQDKNPEDSKDLVNEPTHYLSHPSGVECRTIARHMSFDLGNAIKYIWRADLKANAIEDLEKAANYVADEYAKRCGVSQAREMLERLQKSLDHFSEFGE